MKELERIKNIYKEIFDTIKKYENDIILSIDELGDLQKQSG